MASPVSVLRKKTLGASEEAEEGKFHNLSALDRIMEPFNLRIVVYYHIPANTDFAKMMKNLSISIAYSLSSFSKVTGRVRPNPTPSDGGHWIIKCNDAGVRTIEARAKCSLQEWLMSVTREKELELIYWEEMPNPPQLWSTFYVQFTEFEGGGIAIGLSCTHLIADVTSATMFLKAWADMNLFKKMLSPPLFHPLTPRKLCSNAEDPELHSDLINHYKSSMESSCNPITTPEGKEYSTIAFAFSDEMVRKCILEASSKASPFAALAALFWVCISKVKGTKERLINMCISLDMRKVLGLGKEFFGNCMVFNKVSGDIGAVEEEVGLADAAQAIQNVVGEMEDKARIMDLIDWLEKNTSTQRCLKPINGSDIICANWDNIDPYSAEFEHDSKPIRASYHLGPVFGEGQILILPSKEDSEKEGSFGRVVMVTLPKDEAAKLIEESLILNLSPNILMQS